MLTEITTTHHEAVYQVSDPASGLEGFIALHSTYLGPAAGGLRMRPYDTAAEALEDVLNLSQGMTYKNAAAGLPLGGGKAVIIGNPAVGKTPELLRAMGRAVEALQGRYWTAEDMGMSPDDMAELARETQYVAGLDRGEHASGDPSPVTAAGVFNAMRIGARHRFGSDDLTGLRVAVQGLGHVGWHLARMLHGAGAKLVLADMDAGRAALTREEFDGQLDMPSTIHAADVDIFSPCAIGGILNAQTVPDIKAGLICGAANNQLASLDAAQALAGKGVLYLPDYVANGGGIVNVAAEILKIENRTEWVGEKLATLEEVMGRILTRARTERVSPAVVADRTVDDLILRRAS